MRTENEAEVSRFDSESGHYKLMKKGAIDMLLNLMDNKPKMKMYIGGQFIGDNQELPIRTIESKYEDKPEHHLSNKFSGSCQVDLDKDAMDRLRSLAIPTSSNCSIVVEQKLKVSSKIMHYLNHKKKRIRKKWRNKTGFYPPYTTETRYENCNLILN